MGASSSTTYDVDIDQINNYIINFYQNIKRGITDKYTVYYCHNNADHITHLGFKLPKNTDDMLDYVTKDIPFYILRRNGDVFIMFSVL